MQHSEQYIKSVKNKICCLTQQIKLQESNLINFESDLDSLLQKKTLITLETNLNFPIQGEDDKIYLTLNDKKQYIWYEGQYVLINDPYLTSGISVTVTNSYSTLPTPIDAFGQFYWVSNNQGTKWLPGTLGGTYYPKGMYYSNGVSWEHMENPFQATQSEVNLGSNNDKFVTPLTLENASKWDTKQNLLVIIELIVNSNGQTLFNVGQNITSSYLEVNGVNYYQNEDYTIVFNNPNWQLVWNNEYLFETTDNLKLKT
jgi:hypothetical protein